jgi:hypothetical protein
VAASLKFDLSARAVAVALLALVVVAAGGAWLVAIGPGRSNAAKLQGTIEEKRAELALAQHRHAATAASERAQLGALRTAMPDRLAMPQVVDDLSRLSSAAGVSLDSVAPTVAVAGSGYQAMPITVVVGGRFFAVERFLHLVRTQVRVDRARLEASGRLFDVEGVQLEQADPAPRVTATLTVDAFSFTGQPAPASTTPATTDATGTPTAG